MSGDSRLASAAHGAGASQRLVVEDHVVAAGCVLRARALRLGARMLGDLAEGSASLTEIRANLEAQAGELEAAVEDWIATQADQEAAHALAHRQYWRFRPEGAVMPDDAGSGSTPLASR
jgi:hypothetical protein